MYDTVEEDIKESEGRGCQNKIEGPLFPRNEEIKKGTDGCGNIEAQQQNSKKETDRPAEDQSHPTMDKRLR